MDKIVDVLSGEFVLAGRPNGGTAVLLRSLWVTLLIYLVAISIRSFTEKGAALTFSSAQLRVEINGTISWFGAIFAGSYAAFYSRFAAQWNYLASLYNQIMGVCVGLSVEEIKSDRSLSIWKAAFVEDAQDLHLACKSMFRGVVISFLKDAEVVAFFLASTNSPDRLKKLEKTLQFKAATATAGAPPLTAKATFSNQSSQAAPVNP